jgi:hypothetical protein
MNIKAEKPKMAPSAIGEMVLSFFSGLCVERNLKSGKNLVDPQDRKLYDSPSQSLIERLFFSSNFCRNLAIQTFTSLTIRF